MNKKFPLIALGALLFSLGYPNILGFTIPAGPMIGYGILFYYLFQEEALKKQSLYILLFGTVVNFTGFYWISATLIEFGDLPAILGILLGSLFGIICISYFWCIPVIQLMLKKRRLPSIRDFLVMPSSVYIAAFIMTFIEYFFPQQFNVYVGQPWIIFNNWLGLAPIGGVLIFSFISYVIIFAALRYLFYKKKSLSAAIVVILFIILNPLLATHTFPDKTNKSVNVRLVQPNITSWMKVDAEKGNTFSASSVINKYFKLSTQELNKDIDLIVWPETAYPFGLTDKGEQSFFPPIFHEIVKKTESELFFGGYDVRSEETFSTFESEYNTGFHLGSDATLKNVYHKHILIPFGESLPFGPLNKHISKYVSNMAFFLEGKKFPIFKLEDGTSFVSMICYEYLKPRFLINYLDNLEEYPQFVINLTNDSWYAYPEQEQHLFLGKWRALEFGLPIVRSTNTGISTIITPNGQELDRLDHNVSSHVDIKMPVYKTEKTLFSRFGILITALLTLLCFLFSQLLIKLKYEDI